MPLVSRRTALLIATVLGVTTPAIAGPKPPKAPTAVSVTVEYQRVGRALLALQDQRGKFDCDDLVPRFRAIKLEQAVATPTSRVAAAAALAEIATKIERLRGIKIEAACLENPLAAGCS